MSPVTAACRSGEETGVVPGRGLIKFPLTLRAGNPEGKKKVPDHHIPASYERAPGTPEVVFRDG